MRFIISMLLLLLSASSAFCGDFVLTSPDIKEGQTLKDEQILNGFGCAGANLSPELHWANAPAGTKSFALTVYDPDAPTGSGWWHWVVFNIPADVTALPAGAGSGQAKGLPVRALQSRTDFGAPGFGGACPPQGDAPHRYQFSLYALDVEGLELSADSSAALVGFMLGQHTVGKASLTALYGR